MVSHEDIEALRKRTERLSAKKQTLEKALAIRKSRRDEMKEALEAKGVDLSDIPQSQEGLEALLAKVYAEMEKSVASVEAVMSKLEGNIL